jgi:hypothetical protein
VLAYSWLLERKDGRTFVLSAILNDPAKPIDRLAAAAAVEGAVNLIAADHPAR